MMRYVVYLYPKSNTMKIETLSISKVYNRKGEPYKLRNKMFIHPSGETLVDFLETRFSRPYKFYKQEVIPLVMEQIEKKYPDYYKELKDTKWSWNKNCGCSMCSCSPGFVGDSYGFFEIQVEIID